MDLNNHTNLLIQLVSSSSFKINPVGLTLSFQIDLCQQPVKVLVIQSFTFTEACSCYGFKDFTKTKTLLYVPAQLISLDK